MSKRQSDRKEDIQSAGQTDRVTERQNDSMADSRAAKEPALVLVKYYNILIEDYWHDHVWYYNTVLVGFVPMAG